MNRGDGSQPARSGFHSQAGETSRQASDPGAPLERPPLRLIATARSTYSTTALSELLGSISTSPPSPPNGETCRWVPLRSSEVPLSCRPPQTSTPPRGLRPLPA
jgi:hypothetical protein